MATATGQPVTESDERDVAAFISQIYEDVSGENGSQIDWEKIRSCFTEDAIVVLRTSPNGTSQFTVEGFIKDFRDFYENPAVKESGFREEVLELAVEEYKEMAFVRVVYEARILHPERAPQRGLDYWLLVRRNDTWKVLAVTNEVLFPGEAMPAGF